VGDAPLVAVRAVRLPGHRTVLVLLAADGMLHTWDLSTAARLRTTPVAPLWRRMTWLRDASLTLRCLGTPDGRQFAITGGRGIRTSIWDLSSIWDPSSVRPAAVLPGRASPAAVEFTELTDGRIVIAAATGRTERRLWDLKGGQEWPDERRGMRFTWLRSLYDDLIRRSSMTYYALRGGPPVVAVRFFRKTAIVWDLTASRPLGIWPRWETGAQVRLTDGRIVTVPFPHPELESPLVPPPDQPVPAEDPGSLVPLGAPARSTGQPDHESRELSLRFEMTGRFLRVQVHDYLEKPDRGAVSLTLAGHNADVTGYDWTRLPDGHVIVITASRDGTVRRWDISSIRPAPGEGNEQARVALHRIAGTPLDDGMPVGLTIADADDVALWDLRTGELIGNLARRGVPPCAIGAARPRGGPPIAVAFGTDHGMRICNLPDGRLTGEFPADLMRWPGDAACAQLPDGTCVAVSTGHGRRTVVWDLAAGRIRNVLGGHRGWSACVTCAPGPGLRPLALTGGLDNRVNVWDLRRGRRYQHFRIVPPWTFLTHPPAGRAYAVRAMPLDSGKLLALVATSDGMVRALAPRTFPRGARRTGAVPGRAVGTMTLSNGRAVVVTATDDGIVRVWKSEVFTRRSDDKALLCQINIEAPVNDIHVIDHDTFVIATPNGLTAIQLNAVLLEDNGTVRPRK
jgi:WD40 repeat protein